MCEIRVYPEYVGSLFEITNYLLSKFNYVLSCEEKHDNLSQLHYHIFIDSSKSNKFKLCPVSLRRLIQKYIKDRGFKGKVRNNALHIDAVTNYPAMRHYIEATKPGSYKFVLKLKRYCEYPFADYFSIPIAS